MADQIRMDTHKLIFHPQRVAAWMNGENIYPIEVEISPSGACNHRCVFCAVDYIGYTPDFLDKDNLLKNMEQMQRHGLKSVICSGEGEPLLNRNMPDMANGMKSFGLDVAMSSNGALFTKDVAGECLKAFTWIRFSIASMEEESYNAIQRGQAGDFNKVCENLSEAVRVKQEQKLKTTLGVQCLLMKENIGQLAFMAKSLRDMGLDYLTVKPYSQHLHSENHIEIDYSQMLETGKELKTYETEDFKIHFRANAMKKMHQGKCYGICYGLPFMTHIDAKGNVWPCVAHIGQEEYCYGNINEQTFEEIWSGDRRKQAVRKLADMDINKVCREACRLDEINKYLWELKHPGEHVNFI